WFEAVALAVRDHIIDHWEEATPQGEAPARKRVYYLSLEFLIGRLLLDNLGNLGLLEETRQALAELGVD
ncbi:glycogen phosphorylase, partial [Klebsiella pneumoniae]